MNTDDSSIQNENEEHLVDLSPDMFEDDMDVDFITDQENAESSSKKMKLEKLSSSWRGVSIYDIYKSLSPWSAPEFPLVTPSTVHAVLYHISRTTGTAVHSIPPVPQRGKDVWDKDHVRLPCSNESLYAEQTNAQGQPILRKRWEIIVDALSCKISNSHELQEAILKYNSRYKTVWKFSGLHQLFNHCLEEDEAQYFFDTTLPAIQRLALKLPHLIQCPIPLLRQYHNRSISLSQEQISCLLANAFFCTFPRRNAVKGKSEYRNYPDINFYRLFQCTTHSVMEKLKCIFNYFRRVCKNVPCGVLTFVRRTVVPTSCPRWDDSVFLVGSVPLHISSEGTIEDDGVGLLQVDFANKFLGGGVLGHGCVQEEIRFVICPELLISMLFTESLKPTESLLMIGCEQFSGYTGYADKFQWSKNCEDTTPFDASGRRRCSIVAIDALYFSNSSHQYNPDLIARELNKAWVGYSHFCDKASHASDLTLPAVATGNWGCGAFRGSPHLKSLIQLMACCQVRRPMVYYTFGDAKLREDIFEMYNFLSRENVSVGRLYRTLCQFQKSSSSPGQLYEFIKVKTKTPVLQHFQNILKTQPKMVFEVSSSEETVKPSRTQVAGSASTSAGSFKKIPQNNKSAKSTFIDVEKGLKTTKEQSLDTTNACLFDQMSHLDEGPASRSSPSDSISSKKHGSLAFFESEIVGKSTVTETSERQDYQETESCISQSQSQTVKDKRKSSNKISDYFQRIPKKML